MKGNHRYKICPKCDFFSRVEEETAYCPYCGSKLISQCVKCGREIINPYANYCQYCGEKYPGREAKRNKEAKK